MFHWVPKKREDRAIPAAIRNDPKKRDKMIREIFAFPIGHSFAWKETDLEIDERDRMLVEWGLFQSLKLSSRRTYASTVTTYLRWADLVKCKDPWPLNETKAALFAAWRLRHGKCMVSTIRSNFTHLQEFHRNFGMDSWIWTDTIRLPRVLRGWAASVACPHDKQRLPWLFEIFVHWWNRIGVNLDMLDEVRVWTAALVLFWSLARGGEVVTNSAKRPHPYRTLRWSNLEISEDFATVSLVTSKNDKFHDGAHLLLPRVRDYRFCPLYWLGVLRSRQLADGVTNPQNWLFAGVDGRPLAMEYFRMHIKDILARIDFDANQYNTHSFRIGAATELFRRGLSVDIIKKLGRWKGDTFEMYTRPDAATCAMWTRSIFTKAQRPDLNHITFFFGDEWRIRR